MYSRAQTQAAGWDYAGCLATAVTLDLALSTYVYWTNVGYIREILLHVSFLRSFDGLKSLFQVPNMAFEVPARGWGGRQVQSICLACAGVFASAVQSFCVVGPG